MTTQNQRPYRSLIGSGFALIVSGPGNLGSGTTLEIQSYALGCADMPAHGVVTVESVRHCRQIPAADIAELATRWHGHPIRLVSCIVVGHETGVRIQFEMVYHAHRRRGICFWHVLHEDDAAGVEPMLSAESIWEGGMGEELFRTEYADS